MKRITVLLAAVLLFSVWAFGQAPVGSIAGVVTDPSSAVVPGATVKVIFAATGAERTVTTNDTGYYLVPTLQPGEYKVVVEAKGFAAFTLAKLVVAVGQVSRADAKLNVTTAAEAVQVVSGEIATVDTDRATVGGVVTTRQIEQLPLNGRNYLELAKLEPGVEIQDGRSFDPTKSRYTGISVGSRQGREARIAIDGIDAVDEHVGTTTLNLSQESIQEFQVSTFSSDISTGLSATGGVNVITKSGSNEIHGNGFAYGRGSDFAARPSFAAVKPDFDREQYGVGLGGPAVKNRLFWFGNYEKTQEQSAIGVASPYFPALQTYPAPFDLKSSNVRIDFRLPKQNQLFYRWSRDENSNFGGFGGATLPSSGNVNANLTNQHVWGLDSVFTPRLTNSLRVGYTNFQNFVQRPPVDAQKFAVPGAENFRIVTDDGLLTAGPDVNTPQSTSEKFTQIREDVTYSRGNHAVRIGGDITYRKVSVTNFAAGFPTITITSPASRAVADILSQSIVSATIGNRNGKRIPGTPDNSHRNTRLAWYVDDTWKVKPNFTVSAGLRYEVDTHPLNNDLRKPDYIKPILPNGTDPTPINHNNFAPHLGIAWDPFQDHKTSIRVGGGIYYAMRISNLVTNERASIAPFNSGNDTIGLARGSSGLVDFNRDGIPDYDFTPALTGTLGAALGVIDAGQKVYIAAPQLSVPTIAITHTGTVITNNLKTPYSQQLNAGVQRQLPGNSIIDVNFLYSRTVHEFMRDVDAGNLFAANGPPIPMGDGKPVDRQITLITSDGYSRYRALTVKYDKRFEKRFQLTGSYALSRLETTTADGLGLGAGALVNRNPKGNWGPGALDRTHRFVANGIVDLFHGIRVSVISTAYSGLPTSILVGSADLNGDGINGDLLPGTGRGALGRSVNSVEKLNQLVRQYNQSTGGKTLPRGGRAPFLLEVPDSVRFGNPFVSQDLQVSKTFSIKERVKILLTAQMFNLFNISNLVGPAGFATSAFNGTLTTVNSDGSGAPTGFRLGGDGSLLNAAGGKALAGVDRASGFASFSAVRPSTPTGTGLPRAAQFGMRISF